MANGVKFSSIEEGALRIGNANIAVRQNSVSNPSSYWTSIEPVNGGYTVYIDKPENGPAVYNANSDAELIALGNKLSGQTFSNINECLAWFNSYEEGNRNYFINTSQVFQLVGNAGSNQIIGNESAIFMTPLLDIEAMGINLGDTITLSFDWEATSTNSEFGTGYFYMRFFSTKEYYYFQIPTYTANIQVNNTSKSGHWIYSLTITDYRQLGLSHFTPRLNYIPTNVTLSFSNVKLEKGSVATPWRPAMEDPDYVLDKFVLHSEIPPIVTDGLVLNYDAGLIPSYPRGGTVINDVSGNGNNGTLVNGVGYSSEGGGSLVFDGVNDYVNCGTNFNITTSLSLSAWVKSSTYTNYPRIVGVDAIWMLYIHTGSLAWYGSDVDKAFPNSPNLLDNKWHYVCVTYNGNGIYSYVDGVFISVLSKQGALNSSSGVPVTIGNRLNLDRSFSGGISNVQIYNRSLSQQEILQNYYAGLQKFIPKDGLVLSLSPQNSYFSGSAITSVRDISGNGNDASINNGVAYVREGGGSWSFDGVDDSIAVPINNIPIGNSPRTIVIWFKYNKYETTYTAICGYGIGGTAKTFDILIGNNGFNTIALDVYGAGGISTYFDYTNTNWNQVVAIYTGTQLQLYLNGELKSYNNFNINTSSSNLIIGDNVWSYPGMYRGNISQILFYNRALTESEIQTIYQATKSKYV